MADLGSISKDFWRHIDLTKFKTQTDIDFEAKKFNNFATEIFEMSKNKKNNIYQKYRENLTHNFEGINYAEKIISILFYALNGFRAF